jgi:hypothetical protein
MNEDLNIERKPVTNCTRTADLKNTGIYLCEDRCKWKSEVGKTQLKAEGKIEENYMCKYELYNMRMGIDVEKL